MAAEGAANEQVRLELSDDCARSRLTVFFRLLLVIPHAIWLLLWSLLAILIAIVNWFAILITGRAVAHDLQVAYLRYLTHVNSYLYLAANPYPGFAGSPGYPVDLRQPAVGAQNRWKAAFRLVLALPALLLAGAFGTIGVQASAGYVSYSLGVVMTGAFLGWFAILATGRMPRGLRDAVAFGVSYSVQAAAYLLLVTDRYPDSNPLTRDYGQRAPEHPVALAGSDDLRRSRLTTFFRLLLFLPHLIWLTVWGVAALLVVVVNWFVLLFSGSPAGWAHRFVGAYVRYWTHASAFLYLVANPFPGFAGAEGSYPVDAELPPPERQNRWKTGFRLILWVPAGLMAGALGGLLGLVALFGWFTGVILGRMPEGLRNLGRYALRYNIQSFAYLALIADRYPHASPSLEGLAPPALDEASLPADAPA